MKPAYWQQACAELAQRDSVLGSLIAQYPEFTLRSRGDAFQTLARAIVGQQISVKAADSVWARFVAQVGEVTSRLVLVQTVADLRACGLSARKVEYLQDLARHHAEGRLDPTNWHDWSDEAIIAELVSIRGIGRWSAEMFLIFFLTRPNVLPLDDIGLIKAIARHYHEGERRTRKELLALAENWQPWCSVATWYLWRSLDPVVVEY